MLYVFALFEKKTNSFTLEKEGTLGFSRKEIFISRAFPSLLFFYPLLTHSTDVRCQKQLVPKNKALISIII